ncbi:MAG: ATP-dependent zinc metalloprotease FtsH [Thermotogae bacterium]|nr:ATP-dependent zinc metalloprotease FtsH [Thermotogota bacterium]
MFLALNSALKTPETPSLTYSELMEKIYSGDLISIDIENTGDVYVKFLDGTKYTVYAPLLLMNSDIVENISELTNAAGQKIQIKYIKSLSSGLWMNIISYILPVILFIFLWMMIIKPAGGGAGGMNPGKSPAKKYDMNKNKLTFSDVAGIEEAKEELMDVVKFLKDPKEFNKIGARMPKGMLLVGPPGTGKTLAARAVAGEAGVPFYFISGSDFVELFVGVGAARVRDLFNEAKKNAPGIIFIDEIDAVGRQRGAGLGGGHDEREQTLNQLLVEMDGFDPKLGIVVMAATNRPDILDKALLRPGRFDKKIVIDAPDLNGREDILKIHMRGKKMGPDIDPKVLARSTPGFVGADLENLINEAALLAARDKRGYITMEDCEEAIERVIAGPARKSRLISEKEKKIIAYHELGHAMLGYLLPNADPVHKITIVPRGHQALGYTLQLPLEDKYLMSKSEITDRIVGVLGGRAAEEIVFDEITSGAGNDLKKATEYARMMVYQLGMSEEVGPIAWGEEEGEVFLGRELSKQKNYSEETARELDREIKKIITNGYNKAKEMLTENRERLDLIAKYLLKVENLSGEEFSKIMEKSVDELRQYVENSSLGGDFVG